MTYINFFTQYRGFRPTALVALALACAPVADARNPATPAASDPPARIAPGPHCMDARGLREMNQLAPDNISLLAADQSTWRITFREACPGLMAAADPRVAAPESWVCGTGQERVLAGERSCAIASVQPITRREFAQEARRSDRDGIATLETVNVKEHRRTLRGSPSYCFATRDVRSWSETAQGFTVETRPRTPDAHRRYVVEVGAVCRSLMHSPAIRFRSGYSTGVICGNKGDVVEVLPHVEPTIDTLIDRDAHLAKGDIGVGDRCNILAVYPAP